MEELSERQEEKAGERNSLTHCPNGQKCSNNAENQREVEDPTIQRKSPEKRKNLQSFFFLQTLTSCASVSGRCSRGVRKD